MTSKMLSKQNKKVYLDSKNLWNICETVINPYNQQEINLWQNFNKAGTEIVKASYYFSVVINPNMSILHSWF